jgi:YHS domain-containing protein
MKFGNIFKWPLLLIVLTGNAALAEEPVSKSYFGSIAIGGFDTVAYHDQEPGQHEAIKGESSYTVEWKGAKWRFANKTDMEAFAAEPERYAPAYNGFCANALSLGNGLVKTDGTHWQIFGNQLFLFYAVKGRDRWLAGDYTQYKADADKAWQNIIVSQE